jgi:hypothetical protein
VLILALYPLPIAMASMRKHNAVLAIIVTNLWLGLDRNRLDRGPDLGLQLECGSGRRMSVLLLLGRERRWLAIREAPSWPFWRRTAPADSKRFLTEVPH